MSFYVYISAADTILLAGSEFSWSFGSTFSALSTSSDSFLALSSLSPVAAAKYRSLAVVLVPISNVM